MNWTRELEIGVSLAQRAGAAIAKARVSGFEQSRKADDSLVTSADLASDGILRAGLHDAFPNDAVLTEESGWNGSADAARVWVVDPLDGTRSFARGDQEFSVLVGLIEGSEVILGIAHFPGTGRTFYAMRGQGAFVLESGNSPPRRLQGDPGPVSLTVSPSTSQDYRMALARETGMAIGPIVNGAGAKLICLAEGGARAYFSGHGLSVWDTAAPGLILEEVGGTLTDEWGAPLKYSGLASTFLHPGGIVATVHCKHAAVVKNIQIVVTEFRKKG